MAQRAPLETSAFKGEDSAAVTDPAASAPPPPGNLAPCRFQAASPLGRADELPLPMAQRHLLLILASGPAGPLHRPSGVLSSRREFNGRDRLHSSLWALLLSPRQSQRYPSRPTAAAPSPWDFLFYGFRSQLTPVTTIGLDALGAAADFWFDYSAARYSNTDCAREQQSEPTCKAAMRYITLLAGRKLCPPTFYRVSFPTNALSFRRSRS